MVIKAVAGTTVTTMNNVEPVPFESRRYWVQSTSRPEIKHLVDLDFEGKAACGCEDHMVRGKRCKHIELARAYEQTLQSQTT